MNDISLISIFNYSHSLLWPYKGTEAKRIEKLWYMSILLRQSKDKANIFDQSRYQIVFQLILFSNGLRV